MKKRIAICLEQMGIGGIETFTLNQLKALENKGNEVFVIAKKEIYSSKVEELGGRFIEFEFPLNNFFDVERAKDFSKILKENKIEEVHIHQFPCILSAMPACIENDIPYIAYIHLPIAQMIYNDLYNWYMDNFSLYKILLKFYFENANKIVSITKSAADLNSELFNIDKSKYVIRNNGIDFEEYKSNDTYNNLKKKFLIISRLEKEKINSIKNGIDFALEYSKTNNIELQIAGDGSDKEKIKEYCQNKNLNVKFLGKITNIKEVIKNSDVILGLDRVILEALAMKKIAIILGYENMKGIVSITNIEQAIAENFSGYNLENKKIEEVVKELKDLNDINKLVNENYDYIKEKLDINNTVYTIDFENDNINFNKDNILSKILSYINEEMEIKAKNEIELKNKNDVIERKNQENHELEQEKEELELEKKQIIERNEALKKELEEVYNSKRWRYMEKILGKKRK